jgi:hypothetical protein
MKTNEECPNKKCCKIHRYKESNMICGHYGAGCSYCVSIEQYNKDITKPGREFLNK